MKKMLLIYNPKAGKGDICNNLSYVVEELGTIGYDIVIYPTKESMDATRLIEEKGKDFNIIVCSGGDGILNEVVTGMQRQKLSTPLGYIPAGSTNDFACSLGISKKICQAAKDITNGTIFQCDLGKLNDNYFVYVAAFGMFTDVAYKTSQEKKNILGHLAYVLEGVKSLSELKSWQLSFMSEECSGSGEFLYGMITNSNSVGGFKGITGKNVTLNDGQFEVTLVLKPVNYIEWPSIINSLITGEKNKHVISFKTSQVSFTSEDELSWTKDGEYGGSYNYIRIKNIPKAMNIIVAKSEE